MGSKKRHSKNIIIIGTGNVAEELGHFFNKNKIAIQQVYGRDTKKTKLLASKLKAESITNLNKISTTADLYFICISDDSIEKLVQKIKIKDRLIVHTSGNKPLNLLRKSSSLIGVFYPLQIIKKGNQTDFTSFPILIEGNNNESLAILKSLCKQLKLQFHIVDSVNRKKIHLAAVITSNFSNHLFALCSDYLIKNKLNSEWLIPLIQQTVKQMEESNSKINQTGPARRGDLKVLKEHENMLKNEKQLQKIYTEFSKSIIKTYYQKKT